MTARSVLFLLLLAVGAWPVRAANRYDPRLTFRTIATARFDIHFHQGEEGLARRLAGIAEEVADRLARELGRPSGRVQVVLVNQTDLSNGWATPIPYNEIEINTVPPPGESVIGNTDDWLRLVFSHEYTHIVHLDQSRGWIGGLRHVFGRLPALYPNLFLPIWQIEGIATYHESRLTGEGRVPAPDFRMILDGAAMAGRFGSLDKTSGGLVDWPSGNAAYVYGAYFHQYLADRFGPDSMARLSRETSGRLPYVGSPAFRKVFGRSLGALWNDFQTDTRGRPRPEPNRGTRLTTHGFIVSAPRFSADGRLFYSVADPHEFPALLELSPHGSPRRVANRYLGERTAASGGTLVFDQLELVRNAALQSDLYAVPEDGGQTRRLTRGARAADPDVSPDGRTIVCTVQVTDRRLLATLPFPAPNGTGQPVPLISEASTEFTSPRWSLDGRSIAVERRRLGGASEIVLVDPSTGGTTARVSSARGRNVGPIWLPDGRSLLFASDRDGVAFRLYAIDVATGATRRLEGTGAGAQSPALSPDGRTLVFVGYTVEGYDLFSLPFEGATWVEVQTEPAAPAPVSRATAVPPSAVAARPFRPLRTLLPHFWAPTLISDNGERVAGAETSSLDALGRHAYLADIGWSVSRARPDWRVAYAYDRWWPTVVVDVSDNTDPWRDGERRVRDGTLGLLLPLRRIRRVQTLFAALHAATDAFECAACQPSVDSVIKRRSLRSGWSIDSSRSYGYSISAEEGARFTVTSEMTRRALGAGGNAGALTMDVRRYRRLFPRHAVIAGRFAAASAWGDDPVRRVFSAAGSGSQPGGFRFASDAIGLLRGFDAGTVLGQHVTVANLDYRVPILQVQRGIGTLPFFLRTVHGALFADAGHARTGAFRWSQARTAFGAELSFDAIVGHSLPLTVTTGAAWRTDRVLDRRGVVTFARIGRAF